MQAHRRLIAVGLFLASFVCLLFIKLNSCSSYMESWLGFTPVYVVETAVVVGGAYFFMPKNPHSKDPVLTVCLCCTLSCNLAIMSSLCRCCLIPVLYLCHCCDIVTVCHTLGASLCVHVHMCTDLFISFGRSQCKVKLLRWF